MSKCEAFEMELASMKAKVDGSAKAVKQAQKDAAAMEDKLRAVTAELDKLRSEQGKMIQCEAERDRFHETAERIAQENRSLEKQRSDLVAAFRAQAKLIDVLKRQKAHLESAKLLEISEQEFVRVLGLPSAADM